VLLRRLSEGEMDLLRKVRDEFRPALFSRALKADLKMLVRSVEAVELIEAECFLGNYLEPWELISIKAKARKLLRKRGVRMPRGKQPNPVKADMVERVCRVFLTYGVRLASGEHSPVVNALRLIASELRIDGDPRDDLRRMIKSEERQSAHAKAVIEQAIAKAFRSFRPKAAPVFGVGSQAHSDHPA
jgi:hypothetical protein